MTKDLKTQKLLECKAAAYDSICRLRASVDSHRNFHRLVLNVIASVSSFAKELREAPTSQSEQFPCQCKDEDCEHCHGECKREAQCQVFVSYSPEPRHLQGQEQEEAVLMCDLCANSALHRGTASMIEESCPENGQD